jgi:hypothetical protein
VTPSAFGSLGLKITGGKFVRFGSQNPRVDLRTACGVIGELALR